MSLEAIQPSGVYCFVFLLFCSYGSTVCHLYVSLYTVLHSNPFKDLRVNTAFGLGIGAVILFRLYLENVLSGW